MGYDTFGQLEETQLILTHTQGSPQILFTSSTKASTTTIVLTTAEMSILLLVLDI